MYLALRMQHNDCVCSDTLGIVCRVGNLTLLLLFKSISIFDKIIEVIVYLQFSIADLF